MEKSDELLIVEALDGNKKSLEVLIKRHQDYIYNISLKLFLNPDDALDATQEVLIKVVTSLRTFKGEAKFSTWLYRIAVNHFLNAPTRKTEQLFEQNTSVMAEIPTAGNDQEIAEETIEEVRILCSTAMLMCLSREQRLIYIIGEIFNADHQLGASLFDISAGNFRVKLHRAKTDLLNYVSGKCGLVNPANPCRCNKKAKEMLQKGMIDKQNLVFNKNYQQKINQIVEEKRTEISDEIQLQMLQLFRDSPFQIRQELDAMFSEIVG
jgi:RNA polymerase sigma factor (sigma-70 family)